MDRTTYNFPLELKAIEEDGHFAGYASVFGIEDNHNDIILSGAFSNSLADKERDIKLLWQHKVDEPIGTFTTMKEDRYGLYVEGRLLLDVQRAREAYALLKSGALNGLSIGFVVKHYDRDDSGARLIYEADLWEISLVTFPANSHAQISVLKHFHDDEAQLEQAIERAIAILKN